MKKYHDTARGALACLADESTLDVSPGNVESVHADPSVDGVWAVYLKSGEMAVVLLAGYRDPWGRIRQANDFEVETPRHAKGKR